MRFLQWPLFTLVLLLGFLTAIEWYDLSTRISLPTWTESGKRVQQRRTARLGVVVDQTRIGVTVRFDDGHVERYSAIELCPAKRSSTESPRGAENAQVPDPSRSGPSNSRAYLAPHVEPTTR